ncbi:DUF1579 family protein [Pararhodonellum marinum]|uniref:DUF1579 family protein n=1 Tax=Pararhodonellum marinum TaxID=2755358 RepID=UPI00188F1AFE|nr:DUF1579 family protein [Pararhodonellum marinum]
MKKLILIICLLVGANAIQAQVTSEEAIKKLAFIEGQWQGKSNVTTGPGQNMVLDQHEHVELRLGGQVMIVEGKGYQGEELEFNAFAVITFDEARQEYEMNSWLSTGQKTEAYIKVHDQEKWEWGFEIPQGKIRYLISLNEKGQWIETGEFSQDGNTWYPSFNMLLDKK